MALGRRTVIHRNVAYMQECSLSLIIYIRSNAYPVLSPKTFPHLYETMYVKNAIWITESWSYVLAVVKIPC